MKCPDAGLSKWLLLILLVLPAIPALSAARSTKPNSIGDFLKKFVNLSDSEVSGLENGGEVAKIIDPGNDREIAFFGATKVDVPGQFFLDRFRDIEIFKKSREVLQVGRVQIPASPKDFEKLTLAKEEVDTLRGCSVGNCSMKMTAGMIRDLQAEVDWSAPDYVAQVNRLYRKMLFEYVQDYLQRGNAALAVYADKNDTVCLRDQIRLLLKESPYLTEYVPRFEEYFAKYPNGGRLKDADDFIYWSVEQFEQSKPVVSITHVSIYRFDPADRTSLISASEQIYANHYFNASLGLAGFFPSGRNARDGYLMYLNRSRLDVLGGFFDFMRRWLLDKKILQGLGEELGQVKRRLESQYAAAGSRERSGN